MKPPSLAEVWQCGGGTQSVAIAVLICQGKLPKPDHSIIADTGYERASTWAYMDATLAPRLAEIGVTLVRARASEYAYAHDGLFNKKGTLLVPAYTTQNEETEGTGKMSNFCTTYWKRDVCDNYLRREHGIGKNQNVKWIGFSIDEMRRATRMMASGLSRGPYSLPLGLTSIAPGRLNQACVGRWMAFAAAFQLLPLP